MLPGRGPRAELLAVVAHHPDPAAVLGGVVAQVADDVVDVTERDPVAQPLLGPEDAQEVALVLGGVRAPEVLLGDRRGPEVGVVEDRPAVAGRHERRRHVRLPDALGQPRSLRSTTEGALQLVGHAPQLADPVALGQGGEDRLVVAAPEDLHLAPVGERAQPGQELRALGREPLQQRAGVVQRQANPGMALERLDHREVGLLVDLGEDPPEVADRLMVMQGQRQGDARCHVRLSLPP